MGGSFMDEELGGERLTNVADEFAEAVEDHHQETAYTMLSIRMSKQLVERLEKYAKDYGISKSVFTRIAVEIITSEMEERENEIERMNSMTAIKVDDEELKKYDGG